MLKKDFSASNKQYFAKNKFALLGVGLFIILGVLIAAIFGFNGNFEFKGYYEIEVAVGTGFTSSYAGKIGNIINSYGGRYESYQVASVGDNTTVIIRYMKPISSEKQIEVNKKIEQLSTNEVQISVIIQDGCENGHVKVGGSVTGKYYLYTALTILAVLMVATIFAYLRYNGASAITLVLSCLMATLGLLCVTALLRLTIGQSYFVMVVILNLLVILGCFGLFENIRETSWLKAGNYAQALEDAQNKIRLRLCVISIAVFVAGLLFAFISPTSIKYVALGLLFVSVVLLAVMLYVVPFVWSVLITFNKKQTTSTK